MKRKNLSMRRQTTAALKDPSHFTTKLVKYVTHVRRLSIETNFSMDETAFCSDMVGNVTVDITGTKDLPLKSNGNEKVKVIVCLTTKGDRTKSKTFIVFQGAKRKATALNEEFNPYTAHCSSNFLKKMLAILLVHIGGKTLACFPGNLMQNLMDLFLLF